MVNMSFIAVDIGGTQLRAASYPSNSNDPIKELKIPTTHEGESVFERVVTLINSIWPDGQVEAIGVALPGPVDPYKGILFAAPNIQEWKDFPIADKLAHQFHKPVHVDNDANLAGLAEWKFGAGIGHQHVLYLTISTGIGGGMITNGQVLHGQRGLAAEVGHMMIDPDGPACGCGGVGHVESFANGPSIVRYVKEQIAVGIKTSHASSSELSAKQIAKAAIEGDELSRSAFARAGNYLGMAIANYLVLYDPSIIILGGGVTQAGDLLIEPLKRSLKERVLHPRYLEGLVITKAALGDEAGLLGALALVKMKSYTQ
jgi:glucokinase